MKTLPITVAMMCAASTISADPARLRMTTVDMPQHDAPVEMSVWYPNDGGGDQQVVAENPVFYDVNAAVGSELQAGTHPVVLFSHGMGGTARAQAWLGSALALRGAAVIAVNHPHSTWGDFDMSEGVNHWTRAADLSAALDALQADATFAGHIDTTRTMAAGFSFGGWTALSIGGVTGNHKGIVDTCKAKFV